MTQLPPIVATLIDRFDHNRDSYKSQGYNETQLRREFLDPFFEALGWDVANRQGHAEAYKDVIHEDAIKIGGNTKAPDYCFRIGGARKFFLEAKKPAVNLKDEISPAYQLRRYAWSAKLPLSILTDFEEFAVYDCRKRPNPSDKPSTGRILYLTYRDYQAKWGEIASIFTKEAVLKGSFDKYAVTDHKRGTATVDTEFLKEIETWREALAKNLAARNSTLSVHELNFSVQRTIDRLIFLRICEDRGVEPYGQLQALLNGQNVYNRLCFLYEQADDRYNSGLFHFNREKGRAESYDDLTPKLKIDDKVLKDLLGRLYYPQSPYEFSVFPIEILGQVYEQFLGKVIRLTAGHQAKIEEKPEVKKAGGVYYTPAYIVEYIVKHTVGALCEGKTPKQIAKLTILDPACGSGSFLIGAYRYLLNHHRDWYVNDGPEKHRKELFQAASGEWRVTTQEKKRILLNNIYGVDIDSQAVEVTKLSLLLKVLEGESDETLKRQLSFVHERALPDLGQNIKCGNSLIGPDYFAGQLMPDEDEMRRVNPFDWKAEFPEIMKAGGFDAVIGNPPYGYMIPKEEQAYYSAHYRYQDYQKDLYLLFLERYEQFLKMRGCLGVIVSNTWLQSVKLKSIRTYLRTKYEWLRVMIPLEKVFQATVDTHVLVFRKQNVSTESRSDVVIEMRQHGKISTSHMLPLDLLPIDGTAINIAVSPETQILAKKLSGVSVPLCAICTVFNGVKPFEFGKGSPPQSKKIVEEQPFVKEGAKPRGEWMPLLRGSLIQRYKSLWDHDYWIRYGPWLAAPRDPSIFEAPTKIMVRQTGDSIIGAMCQGGFVARNNLHIILPRDERYDLRYILGLLNSKLMDIAYIAINPEKGEALAEIKKHHVEQLPIRAINLSASVEKTKHDQMVFLVEGMLDLHKRSSEAKAPADKERLHRQIAATDQDIDRLVYDLYGLTEEEINIVEAASVASSPKVKENDGHGHGSELESADRPGGSRGAAHTVAQPAQYAGEGGSGASESLAGAGEPVHGVREPAGQYGPPQDADGSTENQSELGSTREFDTAEGRLSYQELSERLAVPLVAIYDELLQSRPEQIIVTSEWLCVRHKRLADHLFPDWAGRFRDVNVQVGYHAPPPYYEVPIHMRQFCDDLAERLRHRPEVTLRGSAELFAWVDWRFQWIHPFKDFNGRIGRVLLAALLYKLGLPHVETAPGDPLVRGKYLTALQSADQGELSPLTEMWIRRMEEAL